MQNVCLECLKSVILNHLCVMWVYRFLFVRASLVGYIQLNRNSTDESIVQNEGRFSERKQIMLSGNVLSSFKTAK